MFVAPQLLLKARPFFLKLSSPTAILLMSLCSYGMFQVVASLDK
jgi:hypothetical protein